MSVGAFLSLVVAPLCGVTFFALVFHTFDGGDKGDGGEGLDGDAEILLLPFISSLLLLLLLS